MRKATAVFFLSISSLAATPALANDYPTKPIRLIVPFSPGGTADVLGRILAQKLNEKYQQSVIVENKPGVGGNIGAEYVARSSPDGYTLLFGTIGIHSTFDIYPKLSYDPQKDLEPISILAETPNVLIASKNMTLRNTKELIDASQAGSSDQGMFFGSAGFGSSTHIAGELFKYQSKTNISHVPYKGSGPALTDLVGGRLDIMFENFPTAVPLINSGDVRAIAVTGSERVKSLPDVPTIAQDGLPGYAFTAWFSIAAPAGTPKPIVEQLNRDIRDIMLEKGLQSRFDEMGVTPVPANRTAAQSKAFMEEETKKFRVVIKEAKLVAN